jgi:hypothetical protein
VSRSSAVIPTSRAHAVPHRIAKKPYDYDLRLKSLELATGDELDMARSLMLETFPLTLGACRSAVIHRQRPDARIEQWTAWIDDRKAQAEASPSPETYTAVLELYEKSRADLLSALCSNLRASRVHTYTGIPLLRSVCEYAFQQYYAARALSPPDTFGQTAERDPAGTADEEKAAFWSDDMVANVLAVTARQAGIDVVQSQPVWQLLFTFEMDRLTRQYECVGSPLPVPC